MGAVALHKLPFVSWILVFFANLQDSLKWIIKYVSHARSMFQIHGGRSSGNLGVDGPFSVFFGLFSSFVFCFFFSLFWNLKHSSPDVRMVTFQIDKKSDNSGKNFYRPTTSWHFSFMSGKITRFIEQKKYKNIGPSQTMKNNKGLGIHHHRITIIEWVHWWVWSGL